MFLPTYDSTTDDTTDSELCTNNNDDVDDWNGLLDDLDVEYTDIQKLTISNNITRTANIELENNISIIQGDIIGSCSKCNVEGTIHDNQLICGLCGEIIDLCENIDQYNASNDKDHNTSVNSFMSFNIIGKNAYCYQRSFMKTCANYSSYRKNNNKKDMYNYNYQYDGKKIPKDVIKIAVEIFSKIKDAIYVFRGKKKKGVQGACLFYACVEKNLTKTPREIASIMNIEERFLSHGDRILQDLNEKNIISIPSILRPMCDYINQYFPALGIPDIYKPFIIDIINRAEVKNIHIENDSRTTTKVIGAIYLLIMRIPQLKFITKEKIVSECNISKSTFIRYYNLLTLNYILLKKTFKKHKISMDPKWQSDKPLIVKKD
jgi:transcription initiation factor TFIIIB Brf1 subunit/transcription initiation factor TFIIB